MTALSSKVFIPRLQPCMYISNDPSINTTYPVTHPGPGNLNPNQSLDIANPPTNQPSRRDLSSPYETNIAQIYKNYQISFPSVSD